MTTTQRPLAPYEERMLADLRGVVAARAAEPATAPASGRHRRRFAVGLAAVAAVAAVAVAASVAVPTLFGADDRPAYAAVRDPDGSIRVYIREYRDAKGLEAKLRGFGVDAVVDYVPNGKQCQEPRATYAAPEAMSPDLLRSLPPRDGEMRYLKLRPDLIPAGHTFVFTTTIVGDPDGDEYNAISNTKLAIGPVAPCKLVPGKARHTNGG